MPTISYSTAHTEHNQVSTIRTYRVKERLDGLCYNGALYPQQHVPNHIPHTDPIQGPFVTCEEFAGDSGTSKRFIKIREPDSEELFAIARMYTHPDDEVDMINPLLRDYVRLLRQHSHFPDTIFTDTGKPVRLTKWLVRGVQYGKPALLTGPQATQLLRAAYWAHMGQDIVRTEAQHILDYYAEVGHMCVLRRPYKRNTA